MVETFSEEVLSELRGFEQEFKKDFMNGDLKGEDIRKKYIKKVNNYRKLIRINQRKLLYDNFNQGYFNAIKEIGSQVDYEPKKKDYEKKEIIDFFDKDLADNLKIFNYTLDNVIARINSNVAKREIFTKMSNSNIVIKKLLDNNFGESLEKGFNVVTYKNGRKVNFISYFNVVFNSFARKAYEKAHSLARIKNNVLYVKIPNRYTACEICNEYLGRVFFDDVYMKDFEVAIEAGYEVLSNALNEGLFISIVRIPMKHL